VHTAAALIKDAKPIPIRTNKFPRTTYTRRETSIEPRNPAKRKKTSVANFAKPTTYTRDLGKQRLTHLAFQTESKIIPSKPLPQTPYSLPYKTGIQPTMSNISFSEQWERKYTTLLAFLENTSKFRNLQKTSGNTSEHGF
jgi:hypothetical protein